MAQQRSPKSSLQGFLQKQSLHFKKFRKRWIALKGTYLYSYKAQNERKATEIIDLQKFKYITPNAKRFELRSADNKSKRVFVAASESERDEWIRGIQRAIDCIENIGQRETKDFEEYSKKVELQNKETEWDAKDRAWEYFWLSDGCTKQSIHGGFTCAEMFARHNAYFSKAEEPILFRKRSGKDEKEAKWVNSFEDDLVYHLRIHNKLLRRSHEPCESMSI